MGLPSSTTLPSPRHIFGALAPPMQSPPAESRHCKRCRATSLALIFQDHGDWSWNMREILNIVEHLFANAFSRVSWLDMAPQVRWGRVLLCAHSAQSPVKLQEEAPQAVYIPVMAISVRNLWVGVCKWLVWHVPNAGHHHRLTWSTHDACQANSVHCTLSLCLLALLATAIVTFCIHRSTTFQ